MQYILNNSGFVFFFKGRPKNVPKGSVQYAKILKAFDLPADKQDSAICDILDGDKLAVKEAEQAGFSFEGGVKIDGELLPDVLARKIESLKKEGLPITLFLNFWRNLKLNPSSSSVRELYDFLAYDELPITEDGYFLAYKGVQKNGYSVMGNTSTIVLQGKTDKNGHILNEVGSTIEVQRNCVDDNRENTCSFGVHAGSLDYASGWGARTLVVKINPKDVVSVPKDHNCQKLRCCGYEVIAELDRKITAPATDSIGKPIEEATKKEKNAFEERISNYLKKKSAKNFSTVCVQNIQNIFSPEYPDKKRVLAAVDNLGYTWKKDSWGAEFVML